MHEFEPLLEIRAQQMLAERSRPRTTAPRLNARRTWARRLHRLADRLDD